MQTLADGAFGAFVPVDQAHLEATSNARERQRGPSRARADDQHVAAPHAFLFAFFARARFALLPRFFFARLFFAFFRSFRRLRRTSFRPSSPTSRARRRARRYPGSPGPITTGP